VRLDAAAARHYDAIPGRSGHPTEKNMPWFESEDLDDLALYQKARNDALKKIGTEPIPFVYSNKHEFTKPSKKVLPILIVEKDKIKDEIVKAVKASGTVAQGSCRMTKEKKLIFRVAKGTLADFSMYADHQIGEALASERAHDDTPIDLPKARLDALPDMLARQKKKLDAAKAEKAELQRKLDGVKQKVVQLNAEVEERIKAGDADAKKDKAYLAAVSSAQKAVREASTALEANGALVKGLGDLVGAVDQAKTDKEKVEILFDKGKFQEALRELEGTAYKAMMATDDAIMVLGRTQDTWALNMTDAEQPRALAVKPELYSLPANDAFMKGGVDIKARFRLLTPLAPETVAFLKKGPTLKEFNEYVDTAREKEPALWSKERGAPAVSAREVGQLISDGYWFGVYPQNPKDRNSPLVQMMFPKALKPDVHKELLTVFAKMKKS
jgi:hypothetical protein